MASADDIRAKYGPRTIAVSLPVAGIDVTCRRPDLVDQLFHGVLPLPLLHATLAKFEAVAVATPAQRAETLLSGDPASAAFVDQWVQLAMVSPRAVATLAEAGPEALAIEEIDLTDRLAIFAATFRLQKEVAQPAAAATFSGGESTDPPAGPDGATL